MRNIVNYVNILMLKVLRIVNVIGLLNDKYLNYIKKLNIKIQIIIPKLWIVC